MATNYPCIECNFTTNRLVNYTTHLKTKKHLSNISIKLEKQLTIISIPLNSQNTSNLDVICNYCDKHLNLKKNLKRHYSICRSKIIHDKNMIITKLKNQLKTQEKQIKETTKMMQNKKEALQQYFLFLDTKICHIRYFIYVN
jgi:fructose-specific phosphotransferase system component IIB